MDYVPTFVFQFAPPLIALAVLWSIKSTIKYHYIALPERKRWNLGISVSKTVLPDHLTDWLSNLNDPIVHKKSIPNLENSKLQNTEKYIIRDQSTVIVRASPNQAQQLLTIGLIDLPTKILQTRVGIFEIIFSLAMIALRLVLLLFVVEMFFTLVYVFTDVKPSSYISSLWFACPLAIYPLIVSILFIRTEPSRIQQFLEDESANSDNQHKQ